MSKKIKEIKQKLEPKRSSKMTIDEAKSKRGKFVGDKEFEDMVSSKTNEFFADIRTLKFSWKLQEKDKEKKLMSRLPNGKVVFVDKHEKEGEVLPGIPYICLIYEPEENPDGTQARQAYAKIVCEEYEPKIFILPNRLVHEVWRDDKGNIRRRAPHGNSYQERLVTAVMAMEERGFVSIRLVFRGNERKQDIRK